MYAWMSFFYYCTDGVSGKICFLERGIISVRWRKNYSVLIDLSIGVYARLPSCFVLLLNGMVILNQ